MKSISSFQYGPHCRFRAAFTLVELLVVVSIIALLMSMLVPSLDKARKLAKQVTCMTNQRAVGVAIQYYLGGNNSRLPGSEAWVDCVTPHLAGRQPESAFDQNRDSMPAALFCPCDLDPFPKPYMTGEMEVTSYMVNGAETDFAMGGGRRIGIGLFGGDFNLDRVKYQSSCMMLGESTNYNKVVDLDHPEIQRIFTELNASMDDARTRFHHRATSGFFHDGKMTVFYADGHTAAMKGRPVETLPLRQWPGGTLMNNETTFFPGLSLPSAEKNPFFWGPPYFTLRSTDE